MQKERGEINNILEAKLYDVWQIKWRAYALHVQIQVLKLEPSVAMVTRANLASHFYRISLNFAHFYSLTT